MVITIMHVCSTLASSASNISSTSASIWSVSHFRWPISDSNLLDLVGWTWHSLNELGCAIIQGCCYSSRYRVDIGLIVVIVRIQYSNEKTVYFRTCECIPFLHQILQRKRLSKSSTLRWSLRWKPTRWSTTWSSGSGSPRTWSPWWPRLLSTTGAWKETHNQWRSLTDTPL